MAKRIYDLELDYCPDEEALVVLTCRKFPLSDFLQMVSKRGDDWQGTMVGDTRPGPVAAELRQLLADNYLVHDFMLDEHEVAFHIAWWKFPGDIEEAIMAACQMIRLRIGELSAVGLLPEFRFLAPSVCILPKHKMVRIAPVPEFWESRVAPTELPELRAERKQA